MYIQITSRLQFELAWHKHLGVYAENRNGNNYWDVQHVVSVHDGTPLVGTERLDELKELNKYFGELKHDMLINGLLHRLDNASLHGLVVAMGHFLELKCEWPEKSEPGTLRKLGFAMLDHIFKEAFKMIKNPSIFLTQMASFYPPHFFPMREEDVCIVIDKFEACCDVWEPMEFIGPIKPAPTTRYVDRQSVLKHFVPDDFFPISPIILLACDPDEPASEVEVEVPDQSDPDWVKLVLENVLNDAAHSLLQLQTRKATKHMLDIIKQSGERAARILTGFKVVRTHAMKTRAR